MAASSAPEISPAPWFACKRSLEHPFVGVPLLFELRRNPTGFSLIVGVTGHSRATRAVRHLTLGAIIAAERFAREVGAENLKLSAENIADRSNITARYLPREEQVVEKAAAALATPVGGAIATFGLTQRGGRAHLADHCATAPDRRRIAAARIDDTARGERGRSARSGE